MTLQHLDTVIAFAVVMLGASLLITIFTQAMSTLFAHRGSNLRWGLQVLLQTVNPGLTAQQRKDFTEKILTHPILSDSVLSRFNCTLTRRWRLASTIRVEELLRILPAIAQVLGNQAAAGAAPTAVSQMLQAADPAAVQRIQNLLSTLRDLAPEQDEQARNLIAQMTDAAQSTAAQLKNDVESWFNSVMDRVSQRFALQMRIWTIVFSVLLAFAAHLDAFRLFTQLSSDAELRSRLEGSADAMSKQAAAILPAQPGSGSAEPSVVPGIYSDEMKILMTQEPAATKNLPTPPSFEGREKAIQWLREGMKGDGQTDRLVAEYQQLLDAGLKTDADKLLDQSTGIQDLLGKSGYQLVPDPYPQPWYKPWETFTAREFWGTLVAAGLLSLGAPFWFNALKTLSSLRPILATKEEGEQKQKREQQSAA